MLFNCCIDMLIKGMLVLVLVLDFGLMLSNNYQNNEYNSI